MTYYCLTPTCAKVQPEASNSASVTPHSPMFDGTTTFILYIHLKTVCSVCGQFLRYRPGAHPEYLIAQSPALVAFLQTHPASDLVITWSNYTITKITQSGKPYHRVSALVALSYLGETIVQATFISQFLIGNTDVIK